MDILYNINNRIKIVNTSSRQSIPFYIILIYRLKKTRKYTPTETNQINSIYKNKNKTNYSNITLNYKIIFIN